MVPLSDTNNRELFGIYWDDSGRQPIPLAVEAMTRTQNGIASGTVAGDALASALPTSAPPASSTLAADALASAPPASGALSSGALPSAPPASGASAAELDSELEKSVVNILIKILPQKILLRNHMPVDAPEFKALSRGGGNLSRTSVCRKVLRVALDKDNVAMWEPCGLYKRRMAATQTFLHSAAPGLEVAATGALHPVLGISSASVPKQSRTLLVNKLFGHTANPDKQFGQFLCEIGIRSREGSCCFYWKFDPEAWNRMGHRITAGRASGGGKPTIVYEQVPSA